MTLEASLNLTTQLLSLALAMQGLEYFLLSQNSYLMRVWSFKNLKKELQSSFLFSDLSFKIISLLLFAASVLLFFKFQLWIVLLMFFLNLLICLRFRGTFNGGSDMMIFVLLIGLLVSNWSQQAGLLYICIHTMFSYFKAGLSKMKSNDWLNGLAISQFAKRSLYIDSHKFGDWLNQNPAVAKILSISTIAFEVGIILLLFFPKFVGLYFLLALFFHISVFRIFGLNRFFWAWLCAWPSVFYCLGSFL